MFVPAEEYYRPDIHRLFGGQVQYGISTPTRAAAVFLFSSPKGAAAGYQDGWLPGGREYLYSGEGRQGSMELTGGNRAVAEHQSVGKPLHLFERTRPGWYRYVGEMEYAGHEFREGVPGRDGRPRTAIVFRLRPVSRR
jgi:5-methylcytosine-specific restriction protein A